MSSINNEGLFEMSDEMPCDSRDICIWRWALPSVLGHAESEEAAARIIYFSQQLGRWVGVSWKKLGLMIKEDLRKETEEEKAGRCFYESEKSSIVETGDLPENEIPLSGVYVYGPQFVVKGIHDLLEKGFLRMSTEGEGDDAYDVFYPTPKLVERIMEVQGIRVSR